MKEPLVSVIIPVRDLTYYLIFECLPAFENQLYKNFEVIVVPDKRTAYCTDLLNEYEWLKIVPSGSDAKPPEKRDLGVEKSQGEVLAFIDDDAYPHRSWLQNAVACFKGQNVEAVCGPGILPEDVNIWEKVFNEVMRTWAGSGGFSYRFFRRQGRFLDDFPSMNFLIQKEVFQDLGGFNNNYWPGEDSKLCENLVYNYGGKIYYSPGVVIYHHRRNSFEGHLKQHGSYGYHRGSFVRDRDKNSLKLVYLAPTLFFMYLIVLAGFVPIYLLTDGPMEVLFYAFVPLIFYSTLIVHVFTNSFLFTFSLKISALTAFALISTHITYAVNFIKGFFKLER